MFDEVRLPVDIERGAIGGPRFSTSILELVSGHEARNQNWNTARASWNISYGIQSKEDYIRVLNFFYARRGRLRGFRFKDWADFSVEDEVFAIGDGSTRAFQLTKTYPDILSNYVKFIQNPNPITVKIFSVSIDTLGSQVPTSRYTVNRDTGIVTFGSSGIPGDRVILRWTGEFDKPVRFDTDELDLSLTAFNAGAIPNITIREIRI